MVLERNDKGPYSFGSAALPCQKTNFLYNKFVWIHSRLRLGVGKDKSEKPNHLIGGDIHVAVDQEVRQIGMAIYNNFHKNKND